MMKVNYINDNLSYNYQEEYRYYVEYTENRIKSLIKELADRAKYNSDMKNYIDDLSYSLSSLEDYIIFLRSITNVIDKIPFNVWREIRLDEEKISAIKREILIDEITE